MCFTSCSAIWQGMQSYLQALLSLYKLYCPELVTITLPGKMKVRIRFNLLGTSTYDSICTELST